MPDVALSKPDEINNVDLDLSGGISSGLQLPKSFSTVGSEEETPFLALTAYSGEANQPMSIAQVPASLVASTLPTLAPNASRFQGQVSRNSGRFGIGIDLYSPPEFEGGLIVYGEDVAMKIGGFVKADFRL